MPVLHATLDFGFLQVIWLFEITGWPGAVGAFAVAPLELGTAGRHLREKPF
jgi:hypothetical protein